MYWSWGVRETPSADVRHRLVVRHESVSEYSDEYWLLRMVVCLRRGLQRILESLQWLALPLLGLGLHLYINLFPLSAAPIPCFFFFSSYLAASQATRGTPYPPRCFCALWRPHHG